MHILRLPPSHIEFKTEKVDCFPGVTILLSLTVFLNMVVETMPVTSDNPLLGKQDSCSSYKQRDERASQNI